MTWARFDDATPEHPKIIAAGGDAGWLHFAAVCYCNRQLTDGVIPKGVVSRLTDRKNPHKLARKLIEVGLWIEHPEGYAVHDYLDYQQSREQVLAQRAASSERQRKGRAARKTTTTVTDMSRRDNDVTSQEVTALSHDCHAVNSLVPSHPILSSTSRESELDTPAANDSALTTPPEAEPLTASDTANIRHPANARLLADWHATTCPHIDLDHELAKFEAHAKAHAKHFADPIAAAQEWLLRARPSAAGGGTPPPAERPPQPKPWTGDDFEPCDPDAARAAFETVKATLNAQPKEPVR